MSKSIVKIHETRPKEINQTIDETFARVAKIKTSQWDINGYSDKYRIAKINEHTLIKHIISSSPEKSDYYFMDLGAGLFTWLKFLAEFLNETYPDTSKKFHIIGVTGEGAKVGYKDGETIYTPKIMKENISSCQLYKISGFKLESINSQLRELGLLDKLAGKVDFITSRSVFLHLVDPVGTLMQAYGLLAPYKGFMLTDGFTFPRLNSKTIESVYEDYIQNSNFNLVHLLTEIGAKFLVDYSGKVYNHYIIKKTLPDLTDGDISYYGLLSLKKSQFSYKAQFIDKSTKKIKYKEDYDSNNYRGDKELFDLCNRIIFSEVEDMPPCIVPIFAGSIKFDTLFELSSYLSEFFPKQELNKLASIILECLIGKNSDEGSKKKYSTKESVTEIITKIVTDVECYSIDEASDKAGSIITDYLYTDSGSLKDALLMGEDDSIL